MQIHLLKKAALICASLCWQFHAHAQPIMPSPALHPTQHAAKQHSVALTVEKIKTESGRKIVYFRLTQGKTQQPVTLDDLQTVHTQKIHLLIIDAALEDYSHVHPIALPTKGHYKFVWHPKKPGNYRLWVDILPTATQQQEYLIADLLPSNEEKITPKLYNLFANTVGNYHFHLRFDTEKMQVNQAATGTITVTDKTGKPVTNLAPLMGAFAHIVGFYADFNTLVHIHPLGEEPLNQAQRSGPSLQFHLMPTQRGYIKLFAQVSLDGKELVAPFSVKVS